MHSQSHSAKRVFFRKQVARTLHYSQDVKVPPVLRHLESTYDY
jgi:hypothetical protein